MRRWMVAYLLLIVIGGFAGLGIWSELEAVSEGEELSWASPRAFGLLGGCLLLVWVLFHLQTTRAPTFHFSRLRPIIGLRQGFVSRLIRLPGVLRIVAVGLLVVGLARPQTYREEVLKVEGIDIMIVLDLSKSMEERDLRRNRLDAGQRTIRQFLRKRRGKGDRIGLVVFAREAMMQCPLTLDYRSLETIVADLSIGDVPEMGTAIGDALGLSLASLRRSEAQSKVVILVSDGDSNVAAELDPKEAKDIAVKMGVRVFTVLMGQESSGGTTLFGRNQYAVNPALLKEIANDTDGLYFNAGDDDALERSFESIRQTLDKSEKKVVGISPDKELFDKPVVAALILLLIEFAMRKTRWRRFP